MIRSSSSSPSELMMLVNSLWPSMDSLFITTDALVLFLPTADDLFRGKILRGVLALPEEEFSTSTTSNSSPSRAPEAYLKLGKCSLSVNNRASIKAKWLRVWGQKNSNT
ncbi:hypothetical protein HanPSC8_Chr12g0505751 [Helianthus annuus]|nr:hypothetical protein HanPSC8_Chr12g0505751 [Helianthus annuus]